MEKARAAVAIQDHVLVRRKLAHARRQQMHGQVAGLGQNTSGDLHRTADIHQMKVITCRHPGLEYMGIDFLYHSEKTLFEKKNQAR